jgi:iron complex transport system ATP-binding protein
LVNLRVENMEFSYPCVPVLKGVDMEISPGEILVVVGKNGAGKSTFIKCLNRILEPDNGKVFLGERELGKMPRKDIARSMAYLSQRNLYTFPVTVFDVVLSGRYPYQGWASNRKDEARVEEVLRMMELEDLAMRHFNEISGGQQQQVLIARAIVQESSVFLLDEPTNDLDIRHQLEVLETVRKITRQRNISAVITIHDLNLASRYADRVIMLKDGLIFASGNAVSVFTEKNIAQAYGVQVSVDSFRDRPHIIPVYPI